MNGFEQIEALNTATGGTKWRIEKATDSVTREVEMEVATKVMCVNEAADDPHVQAHDAARERKTWTSPIRSSALLIAHGVLYVTSENQDAIYALNTATGASPAP